MCVNGRLICVVCLTFIFSTGSIVSQTIPYDTVVCFGDSTSDTGNVYNLTNSSWPPAPFYQGRFSNGPVWIEKLGIPTLLNYAYGSATTDNNLVPGTTEFNTSVPGIRQQIGLYKSKTDLTEVNFDRTLYAVWANGNDYYFNMSLSPSTVVNSLINGIQDLIQIGAKKILILTQIPLQIYPAAQLLNLNDFLSTLTLSHNTDLSNQIANLRSQNPQISFYLHNVSLLITNILNNTSRYGINSTQNCWITTNHIIVQLCSTPDTYMFIDEYHFTTRIHQMIADDVKSSIQTSHGLVLTAFSIYFYIILNLQMFIS